MDREIKEHVSDTEMDFGYTKGARKYIGFNDIELEKER